MGGVVARAETTATAFAQREAGWLAWIIGIWSPARQAANVEWARAYAARSSPTRPADIRERARARGRPDSRLQDSYGPNWDRLVELKRR